MGSEWDQTVILAGLADTLEEAHLRIMRFQGGKVVSVTLMTLTGGLFGVTLQWLSPLSSHPGSAASVDDGHHLRNAGDLDTWSALRRAEGNLVAVECLPVLVCHVVYVARM